MDLNKLSGKDSGDDLGFKLFLGFFTIVYGALSLFLLFLAIISSSNALYSKNTVFMILLNYSLPLGTGACIPLMWRFYNRNQFIRCIFICLAPAIVLERLFF